MAVKTNSLSMVKEVTGVHSNSSFKLFYQKYVSPVRNVMYRMGLEADLDDAVQDCFIKAWRGLKGFAGNSSEKTWITRIAVNTALDYLRIRKKDILDLIPVDVVQIVPSGQKSLEAAEIVMMALRTLKPDMRAVLVLSAMEGYSMEEIGSILDIPLGTVKSRLHTARHETELILRKLGVDV